MRPAHVARGRAVIYLRVSSDDQTKGVSLTVQERDCRAWCDSAGIDVAAVFKEPESAKSDERPEFQKAVRFCASKRDEVSHFIIWKLDRFARVALDTLSYRAAIAKAGARLVSVLEPAIGSDPVGKLVTTMLAGVAEYDNDAKAERVVACMSKLLEDGYWTHCAPLGYQTARVEGRPTLVRDPDRAQIVAEAFARIARREATAVEAMRWATARGLRTKSGHALATSAWYDLLANPVYCGRIRTTMTRGRTYRGRWEPIVTPETWDAAQVAIRGDRTGRTASVRAQEWPLRGFLLCPCGATMTASVSIGRGGTSHAYYHCRKSGPDHARIRVPDVEGPVIDAALSRVGRVAAPMAGIVRHHVAHALGSAEETSAASLEAGRKQLALLERKQSRLLDAMLAGRIPEEAYDKRAVALSGEIEAIRRQIEGGEGEGAPLELLQRRAEFMLRDLPGAVRTLGAGPRMEFLRALWPQGLTVPARGVRGAEPALDRWPPRSLERAEQPAPVLSPEVWRADSGGACRLSDAALSALDRAFAIVARHVVEGARAS